MLAISVYTEEEADRRAVEDDEFYIMFDEITEDVKVYLDTDEGKKAHDKEVRRREAGLWEDVELRDDIKTGEILKMRGVKEVMGGIERRKAAFEANEEMANHGFKSISEPIALLNEQQEKVNAIDLRIAALQKQSDDLNAKLALSWSAKLSIAAEDLVQKYCVLAYRRIIKRFRIYASVKKVRRPWDGEDGAAFADWMNKFSTKYSSETMKISDLEGMMKADEEEFQKQKAAELLEAAQLGKPIPPEFDWDGTDNMEAYENDLYQRYKEGKNTFGNFAEAFNNIGKFIGNLFGKK